MTNRATPGTTDPRSREHLWRAMGVTSLASAAWVAIAGAVMVAEPWSAMARFNSVELVPAVVGLEITRAWGAMGAAVVVCLHITAYQHFADGVAPEPRAGGRSRRGVFERAVVAACAVPALYLPVSALAFGSAMVAASVGGELPAGSFFRYPFGSRSGRERDGSCARACGVRWCW
jgi:hypothetical protein